MAFPENRNIGRRTNSNSQNQVQQKGGNNSNSQSGVQQKGRRANENNRANSQADEGGCICSAGHCVCKP